MYSLSQKLIHKINLRTWSILASDRRNKLNNTDFTIISNNCWGGVCYEYFGLPKLSPTVGGYFYAEDYIKFIFNLQYYLNCDMKIINADKSKHYCSLQKKNQLSVPVGVMEDIEFIFLHYADPQIALDKWRRRTKRVNYNNIILKFSYMNECNDQLFKKFMSINMIKKIGLIGGGGGK